MRLNGQYLKKYSAGWFCDVVDLISRDWKEVYSDCKIANISVAGVSGNWNALVVFEEMEK